MRRLLIALLLAACLLPGAAPVRAQATADQFNKLSLEALTTPAPGGNPGPARRSAHRSFYRGLASSSHPRSYRRSARYAARPAYGRSPGRAAYRGVGRSAYRHHAGPRPAYRAYRSRRSR